MAHRSRPMARRDAQRGLSLLVGLIMLVMLTLFAISAFNVSNVNLRVAGNMQVQQETQVAAQTATEQVLNSPQFIKTTPPDAVVDLNGASYTVKFTPAPVCTGIVDIPSEDLDPTNEEDLNCIPSAALRQSGIFISGRPLPPSYCANTTWDITAKVADANSGADTTMTQGVGVRVSKPKALTYCP